MMISLLVQPSAPPSAFPFRLVQEPGAELAWANAFLDAQRIRQLSPCSLRAYAYDLLHLARWFDQTQHTLAQLDQSLLLDYVRFQLDQQPPPTSATINHRLGVLQCLYRFHYGRDLPAEKPYFPAHLYDALPSWLWPAAFPGGQRLAIAAAPTPHRPPLGRPSCSLLEKFLRLSRSSHRGSHAARWSALLRNPPPPTRRLLPARSPPPRPG